MARSLDPEQIDLAEIAESLRAACGRAVEGDLIGRTRLRDELVERLGCSTLEGETLVDTMIGRGFFRRRARPDGIVEWVINVPR
jgi:hypothetical protein